MSEYWVSKKKYFCKYCEIYIADDAPSRQQHENGLRHKGNRDRFIRGLYKAGERKKKDAEEEKREVQRVEQAARAAFAQDVHSGHASGSSSSDQVLPKPKPKAPPPPKPSNPYANYSTAASLGYVDPDVERYEAEAKLRQTEGRVGQWVTVAPPLPQAPEEPKEEEPEARKRELEQALEDEEDTRKFKMRKKAAPVGLGEIYDPGIIKVKPRTAPTDSAPRVAANPLPSAIAQASPKPPDAETPAQPTDRPAWTSRGWKPASQDNAENPGEFNGETTTSAASDESSRPPEDAQKPVEEQPAPDEEPAPAQDENPKDVAVSEEIPSGQSMFRKRKVPAAGAVKRGTRR